MLFSGLDYFLESIFGNLTKHMRSGQTVIGHTVELGRFQFWVSLLENRIKTLTKVNQSWLINWLIDGCYLEIIEYVFFSCYFEQILCRLGSSSMTMWVTRLGHLPNLRDQTFSKRWKASGRRKTTLPRHAQFFSLPKLFSDYIRVVS